MNVPGYWMNETSGVLEPIVCRYLSGDELEPAEVAAMRAYVRQWVAGDFYGQTVAELRSGVDAIQTTAQLRAWLRAALTAGIDPL